MQTSYYLHPYTDTDLLSLALKDRALPLPGFPSHICIYVYM